MREILASVSKLSIPTALNLISSILRNKVLALVTGSVGLGIYSQLINLSTLITSILPIGSLGLVAYTSKYYEEKKIDEISSFTLYFLKRNLIFSFSFTAALLFFNQQIGELLFSDTKFGNFVILFAFSLPFSLLLNFIDIYLRGIRIINKYVFFLSINSIVFTILTVPLVYTFGINGAVWSIVISMIVNLGLGFLLLKKNHLLPNFQINKNVEKSTIRDIYGLGLGVLITLVAQNVTILAIKALIASKLGLSSVGQFQCIYTLSSGYFGIFFSLMASYSIPKVSAMKNNYDINLELNNTIKFLIIIYTPIIISMFVIRSFVITFLYSHEFLEAKELLLFQLPAEFIRAMSWVVGMWLIPKFKIKQWIIFDSFFYLSFFLIFYVLIMFYDFRIKAASISYFVSYIILFILYFLYSIRIINFKINSQNLRLLFFSITFLLISFTASYLNEIYGYYFLFPLLIIWGIVIIKKKNISEITEYLKFKVK